MQDAHIIWKFYGSCNWVKAGTESTLRNITVHKMAIAVNLYTYYL